VRVGLKLGREGHVDDARDHDGVDVVADHAELLRLHEELRQARRELVELALELRAPDLGRVDVAQEDRDDRRVGEMDVEELVDEESHRWWWGLWEGRGERALQHNGRRAQRARRPD
jgi:hypothetical protein